MRQHCTHYRDTNLFPSCVTTHSTLVCSQRPPPRPHRILYTHCEQLDAPRIMNSRGPSTHSVTDGFLHGVKGDSSPILKLNRGWGTGVSRSSVLSPSFAEDKIKIVSCWCPELMHRMDGQWHAGCEVRRSLILLATPDLTFISEQSWATASCFGSVAETNHSTETPPGGQCG